MYSRFHFVAIKSFMYSSYVHHSRIATALSVLCKAVAYVHNTRKLCNVLQMEWQPQRAAYTVHLFFVHVLFWLQLTAHAQVLGSVHAVCVLLCYVCMDTIDRPNDHYGPRTFLSTFLKHRVRLNIHRHNVIIHFRRRIFSSLLHSNNIFLWMCVCLCVWVKTFTLPY